MSDRRAESDALHARARAFIRAFEAGEAMPESFDALGCDLARFQATHITGYARLCSARRIEPQALCSASDAPAVPTDAFKLSRVATFPPDETRATFRTSGTTIGARGTHELRDAGTYDAGATAFGRWALLGADATAPVVLVLGPSPAEAPDSSLTYMLARFVGAFGAVARESETYFVEGDVLDIAALDRRVARALVESVPVLMLGTSFAFVHLLEALGDACFRLPPQSTIMQTGGFKGRSREIDAATLRRDLGRAFAVDEMRIVSEYGMTELSSQFYEATLRAANLRPGVYVEPPWARVVPVDPETLAPVRPGEVGIARIEDLLNVDSAFAVLAADRVRRVGPGFELLGRAPGATPRGCSIAMDEILGKGGES